MHHLCMMFIRSKCFQVTGYSNECPSYPWSVCPSVIWRNSPQGCHDGPCSDIQFAIRNQTQMLCSSQVEGKGHCFKNKVLHLNSTEYCTFTMSVSCGRSMLLSSAEVNLGQGQLVTVGVSVRPQSYLLSFLGTGES